MTRINSSIPVRNLTDEQLVAEHHEIARMPHWLRVAQKSGSINNIPKEFTLGKGHVLFFVDKQGFIQNRYNEVRSECVRRGFNMQDFNNLWDGIEQEYRKQHIPTSKENAALLDRITERITNSPKQYFHYEHKRITKQQALEILKQG